jgi:hypothetical protein
MIPDEILAAWLRDSKAQLETVRRVEQVAARLRELPALARLEDGLAEAQQTGADGILALARELVAAPDAMEEILEALIGAARQDPFFRPHFSLAAGDVHSGLTLFDRQALTITLAVMNADAIAAKRAERLGGGASLIFTGRRSFFHFIRTGGATLSFWEAPVVEGGFTASDSGRCRLIERRRIRDGETVEMDGRRFTFIVDEAVEDIAFVHAATSLGAAPLAVEYDSATLGFVGASSTDEASSRTQMMLALLRIMDRKDAVPVFREMLISEHFYARWQTMRELLALDAAAALPHLRTMAAEDPHPEVRQAAAHTLARFFSEAEQHEEDLAECRS